MSRPARPRVAPLARAFGDDLPAVQPGRRLDVLDQRADGARLEVPLWRSLAQLWPEEDVAVAMSALEQFDHGLTASAARRQLSGGQQQRVRHRPRAGSGARHHPGGRADRLADPRNTRIVMDALLRINKHFGITVICNLHSLDLARGYCDRLIGMASGRIVFDGAPATLTEHIARELYDLEANEVNGCSAGRSAEAVLRSRSRHGRRA